MHECFAFTVAGVCVCGFCLLLLLFLFCLVFLGGGWGWRGQGLLFLNRICDHASNAALQNLNSKMKQDTSNSL